MPVRASPTIAAGLIAAGISVVSFGFNAWTTSRTLHAARAANLRDRQADVYHQVLAFASHQTMSRRMKMTRRRSPAVDAGVHELVDSYIAPNWFDLQASVLAFCPGSVAAAFIAAKEADDAVMVGIAAHNEAVELNQADPSRADPDRVHAFGTTVLSLAEKADQIDAELIDLVRDKMLGALPKKNSSLIGMVTYEVRARRSLRY